ncbi:unnamed protein product [Peniophora sp. CBMAI 1063]|nr:unnamed protein product [Peniophora sp. CBMAI 1063]
MDDAKALKIGMYTAKSHLIATFLVTLFLGFNLVLCFVCVQILVNRRYSGVANSGRLIFATLLQMCICVGHASTYLYGAMQAYIHNGSEAYGAARYLNDHWAVGWKAVQLGFFTANDVCYNTILIWRCHVVMNSSWRYTIPLIVVATASAVGGFGTAVSAARLPTDTGPITFFRTIVPYLTVFNLTSCVVQVVASSLIAWRVWAVVTRDADAKPRSCGFCVGAEGAALRIVIESGVMRTMCGILLLPLVWRHNIAGVIVAAVAAQVDATASYLIIIRTDSLRSNERRRGTTNFLSSVRVDSFQLVEACNTRPQSLTSQSRSFQATKSKDVTQQRRRTMSSIQEYIA